MLSLRKERRHRKAVELICHKLEITDEELNAFIENKQESENLPVIALAKEVIANIESCETVESLEQFKDDTRVTVKTAYDKKLKELE